MRAGDRFDAQAGRGGASRAPRLVLAALAAYGLLQWFARPATPFEWDEVLAQRAVLKYDVATHSPQPPGFPAYIGAAKAVNVLAHDPLLALQVVGIFAALTTLAATWTLARRLNAPPLAAAFAAALVAASPEFLYLSGVGTSDVAGTAATVLAVLALVVAAESPGWLPVAGVACGLVAGVRPQDGAAVVPALAWVTIVAVRDRRWRQLALGAGAAVATAAASWVPAILATGPSRWWSATTSHVHYMAMVERARHLPGARLGDIVRAWLLGSFVDWRFAAPVWALVVLGTVALVRTGRGRLAAVAGASAALYLASGVFTMNDTVTLRYLLPATPFIAILAAGAVTTGRRIRWAAATLVTVWCLAAVAWTWPALRERRRPAPVWAALTWVRTHCDHAATRVVFDRVAAPHVEYVLGRAGFRIADIEEANAVFTAPPQPGEQTIFVTPLPVPGAEVLFQARHSTSRIAELAWRRYGSCAVSRLRETDNPAFSAGWAARDGGWLLSGTRRIQLPAGSKPAAVRVCAGLEAIRLTPAGGRAESIAPMRCAMTPLFPGADSWLEVSGPPGSPVRLPPLRFLPLAAVQPAAGLASAYLVPQAAHLAGFGSAFWRTDLVVINPEPHALTVTAQFLPTETDNRSAPAVTRTLAPGQLLDAPDVLANPRFASAGRLGALLLYAAADGSCGSECGFTALSRTYNSSAPPSAWRADEWLPGVAPAQAMRGGDEAVFSHVTNSAEATASVGFASWTDAGTRVRFRVLDATGAVVEKQDLELPPFGHLHVPLSPGVTDGRVEVELVGAPGDARVVPYLSTVDRETGLPAHTLADVLPDHRVAGTWAPPHPIPLGSR